MGSRTDRGEHVPIINPVEHPSLHVVTPDGGQTYRYVPGLHGVDIRFGTRVSAKPRSILFPGIFVPESLGFTSQARLTLGVPLLPPRLSKIPGPIDTTQLVAERIHQEASRILAALTTDTDILTVVHGSLWGFLPENVLADLLRQAGLTVENSYPRVGGRKRIQEHALLIKPN